MANTEVQPIPGANFNSDSRVLTKLMREATPELLGYPDFIQKVKYYIAQDLLREEMTAVPLSLAELKQMLEALPVHLSEWQTDFFLTTVDGMRLALASEQLHNLNQLDHWLEIKKDMATQKLEAMLRLYEDPDPSKSIRPSKKKRDHGKS